MAGYHLRYITKGTLGEFSKIKEEFEEFLEAIEQNAKVMAILELSDLLGAIEHYYKKQHNLQSFSTVLETINNTNEQLKISHEDLKITFFQCEKNNTILLKFVCDIHHYIRKFNLTIQDLSIMSNITQRAFINGHR